MWAANEWQWRRVRRADIANIEALRALIARNTTMIPLNQAMLCMDCNFIISPSLGACARCGSKALMPLQPILDRKAHTLADKLPRAMDLSKVADGVAL